MGTEDEKKGRLEKFWDEGGSGSADGKQPPTEGQPQKVPIFIQLQVAIKEICQQCGSFVTSHSTSSMPREFVESVTCNREQFIVRKIEEAKIQIGNAIGLGRKCQKCGNVLPV